MASYYLHTGAAGAGTLADPTSLDDFIDRIRTTLNPGDTVWWNDGTYTSTREIRISRNGASGNPITFRAVNAGMAHLRGPALQAPPVDQSTIWHGFDLRGQYVHVIGLKISRIPYNGVVISSQYCKVQNCEIYDCGKQKSGADGGQGILIAGSGRYAEVLSNTCYQNKDHGVYAAGGVSDVTIDGNVVYSNGYLWNGSLNGSGRAGIQVNGVTSSNTGSQRITITNNRVYSNTLRGILCLLMLDSTIEGNVVYANGGDQIQLSQGSCRNIVTDNDAGSDTRACLHVGATGNFGASIDNELTDNRFYCAGGTVPLVPVSYDETTCLSVSGGNKFRATGVHVASDSGSGVLWATYQATFADATSTFSSATPAGLSQHILDWLGLGGGSGGGDGDPDDLPDGDEDEEGAWVPGYQTTVIGMDEARLVAFVALLQSVISDLDTVLNLSPLSMPAGSATGAQVVYGDPYTFPDTLPFVICVMGGGRNNHLDMEIGFKHSGMGVTVSTFSHAVYTAIRVYVHPNTFPAADQEWASIKSQVEKRERLIARICDWLRARVLETASAVDLTLASQEQQPTGDNLTAKGGSATYLTISKGLFDKSFGGSMGCPGAEIVVASYVQ